MSATPDPGQIQEEIEQTREQLGDTVEALAKKADVKRQAKRKVEQTKTAIAGKPLILAAAAAAVVALTVGRVVTVRRKARKDNAKHKGLINRKRR